MKSILLVAIVLALGAGAVFAKSGNTFAMRDGSTIVLVGGVCLVQYGRGNERINNARGCGGGDIRAADRIISGGSRYGGPEDDVPGGSWAESCREGRMRGPVLHAQCRSDSGRLRAASLDMRHCSSGDAENHDGFLVCE